MNNKVIVKLVSLPISKGISETYPYQEVLSCKFKISGKVLECNVQNATNESPYSMENYYDGENVFFVKSDINIDEVSSHLSKALLKGVFDDFSVGDTYIIEFDEEGWII